MWSCPNCGRLFKRKDQQHSCRTIVDEDLFSKRPPILKELFERILSELKKFGQFRIETLPPDVIYFKTKSTFLGIKVKKDHLEVEFFLDRIESNPPVSKFLQTSKHRIAHVVPVDRVEEINQQLLGWMKFSYELISTAQ